MSYCLNKSFNRTLFCDSAGFAYRSNPTGIDLNAVRLCFQVFLEGPEPNTYTRPLTPVVSEPIYDKSEFSFYAVLVM